MKSLFKHIIVAVITAEARAVLRRYQPKIIAVTGSVGKTSTKDAIYTVLAAGAFVRKSEKSFNSEIGVPLTILGQPNGWYNPFLWLKTIAKGALLLLTKNAYPEMLVLEIGADRPGDIHAITRWVHPDVVVVTRLPDVPVHVEFFKDAEALATEKAHLVHALRQGGTLVLNSDDERVWGFRDLRSETAVTYGLQDAVFTASHERVVYENEKPAGIGFRLEAEGNSVPVTLHGVLGRQHVYPVLAAAAVGRALGMNMIAIGESLHSHTPAPGRMRVLPALKGATIIDDSYNSSPVAVAEALETLRHIETKGRKIALLGDMLELGAHSSEAHKAVGKQAADIVTLLMTVGVRARAIAEGALAAGMSEKRILQYEKAERAGKELELLLREGDVVLIKGSQGMRMERAVEEVMLEPQKKEQLLVRQDPAWQRI